MNIIVCEPNDPRVIPFGFKYPQAELVRHTYSKIEDVMKLMEEETTGEMQLVILTSFDSRKRFTANDVYRMVMMTKSTPNISKSHIQLEIIRYLLSEKETFIFTVNTVIDILKLIRSLRDKMDAFLQISRFLDISTIDASDKTSILNLFGRENDRMIVCDALQIQYVPVQRQSSQRISTNQSKEKSTVITIPEPFQQEEKENGSCRICMAKDAAVLIDPCGHTLLCSDCCRQNITHCPLCRSKVVKMIRVFTS
eukprot:TRINITY_DN8500_c0_g1_i1.p1 TRINITY_DN8500_c0_g1~~TRINITY_DN8500_c0_g1_i1.p1  ORF type:complete len:253 (+),score=17.62 TRINITY_DN8500_c0_g1_i1:12-770(+)